MPAPRKKTASKRSPGRLEAYRKKRDFSKTPEPHPKIARRKAWRFAVQRHDAQSTAADNTHTRWPRAPARDEFLFDMDRP